MRWPVFTRRLVAFRIFSICGALAALTFSPLSGLAQTCTDCEVYAAEELNLRQDPSVDAPVLRIVPAGAPLLRTDGAEQNGYVPVSYDSVPGWALGLALVASSADVGAATSPEPAPEAPAVVETSSDDRETLAPLMLRSGPAEDAEPLLSMPEGAIVTLTREGAENGYVTVDYDGVTGWAYADLLGEAGSASAAAE